MKARAKVNLTLEVLGARADGYHDLRSLVVPVSLADDVSFAPADDISLSCRCGEAVDASFLGAPDRNLVWRAAALLRSCAGCSAGAAITLEKHIPIGAGLGGGSADAAATLVGLNDFWGLGFPANRWRRWGPRWGVTFRRLFTGAPS